MTAASDRTRFTPYLVGGLVLLATVVGRVTLESRSELSAGRAAETRGDIEDAVRRLRRAAHWYFPGNPYATQAYDQLESIAVHAEAQGRTDHALSAWRAIRSSALGTRWLLTPERERLSRANRHIAARMAELPQPADAAGRSTADLRADYLRMLERETGPEIAWVVVMGIGFLLWLGGAYQMARTGWDDADRPRRKALLQTSLVSALGLVLFLVGVARA